MISGGSKRRGNRRPHPPPPNKNKKTNKIWSTFVLFRIQFCIRMLQNKALREPLNIVGFPGPLIKRPWIPAVRDFMLVMCIACTSGLYPEGCLGVLDTLLLILDTLISILFCIMQWDEKELDAQFTPKCVFLDTQFWNPG